MGCEKASRDQWKAQSYKLKARRISKEEIEAKTPRLRNTKSLTDFAKLAKSELRTSQLFSILRIYNLIRLALLRINRITSQYNNSFLPKNIVPTGNVPFAVIGLSFGLELLIDFGVIIKSLVKPGPGESKSVSQRFKNIINKDNRPYRMGNAALWFSINLAAILLTGGASIILNLVGFSCDVVIDSVRGIREYWKHHQLLQKVNQKIAVLKEQLKGDKSTTFDEIERAVKKGQLLYNPNDKLEQIRKDHESLLVVRSELQNKMKTILKDRGYQVVISALILVGMAFIFLSPASPFVLGGALLTLIVGSVAAGLGRYLWNTDTGKALRNKVSNFCSNAWKSIRNSVNENILGNKPVPEMRKAKSYYSLDPDKIETLKKAKKSKSTHRRLSDILHLDYPKPLLSEPHTPPSSPKREESQTELVFMGPAAFQIPLGKSKIPQDNKETSASKEEKDIRRKTSLQGPTVVNPTDMPITSAPRVTFNIQRVGVFKAAGDWDAGNQPLGDSNSSNSYTDDSPLKEKKDFITDVSTLGIVLPEPTPTAPPAHFQFTP